MFIDPTHVIVRHNEVQSLRAVLIGDILLQIFSLCDFSKIRIVFDKSSPKEKKIVKFKKNASYKHSAR